jgi:rhodanese-related sulfurtransferase
MRQLSVADLAAWLADPERDAPLLLDVREPWEFGICHIAGSQLMPMNAVPARCAELDSARETVVICHHGGRSAQVCMFLEHQGFERVANLAGGVDAWAGQVEPTMARY